ncbi:MAG: 3-oxoacyl-ACP synthase [Myxococcaceae bacterium]|nr:3-oxoacyl-ACP synthase [Myxococcaceae bacterium]
MLSGIVGVEISMPAQRVAVADYLEELAASAPQSLLAKDGAIAQFVRESGQSEFFVGDGAEPDTHLCELARSVLARFDVAAHDVGLVIYGASDIRGRRYEPVHRVAHELGIGCAELMYMFVGCSTGLTVCDYAVRWLSRSAKSHALVLVPHFVRDNESRFMGFSVQGDGAAVVLIAREGARYLWRGFSTQCRPEWYGYGLDMDVGADALQVVGVGASNLLGFLAQAHVAPSDVALYLPINTNLGMCRAYSMFLRIPPPSLFTENIASGGHIGGVDVLRNLATLDSRGVTQVGEKLVMFTQAIGMSYHAALLEVASG